MRGSYNLPRAQRFARPGLEAGKALGGLRPASSPRQQAWPNERRALSIRSGVPLGEGEGEERGHDPPTDRLTDRRVGWQRSEEGRGLSWGRQTRLVNHGQGPPCSPPVTGPGGGPRGLLVVSR